MPKFNSAIDAQKIPVVGLVPQKTSTAPASPVEGQLWVDTSVTPSVAKVYEDGTWVAISNRFANLPVGTGANQVAAGNDSRFTDSRAPSGSAGGDLSGSYPNPSVAALAITDSKVAAANKDGAVGTPSLRTLGTGAQQALPGNTRLDQIAAPTTAVSANGQRITSLGTPTADTDAANKQYVDSARAGLRLKDAVRAATTANITLSGTQTIDGVALAAGDRVLVKNQSTASGNGIYVVAAGAWSRSTDADAAAEVTDGATTFVQQGGQADTTWAQINAVAAIGTDAQSWVQQGAAASYVAGAGLTQSGQTFDVVAADGSIVVTADAVSVGLVPISKGGTGATTAAAARTALGVPGEYIATLGAMTAGTELVVAHNLGTLDVAAVTIRNVSSGYLEQFDVRVIDANSIGITSGIAYSASTFRVVVLG